ncbi:hypothetical protein [Carnobacterium maltaromaticum]|uniref:hypothetical protein n=1 Tax=Carnobacterium maltaromaticum TaxID=2751 RepID=UPI0012FC1086|nr:hypothetical protein [Carnobacterium maltaromaticum]
MEFVVITKVYTEAENGKKNHIRFKREYAKASNPTTAVVMTGQDFFNQNQKECDGEVVEQEAIVAVYEVIGSESGSYNHLDAINDSQQRSRWGTEQWEKGEALEKELKELRK